MRAEVRVEIDEPRSEEPPAGIDTKIDANYRPDGSLKWLMRGFDDVEDDAHHHVDRRDEQGGDGSHAGGMGQIGPGVTAAEFHVGTILNPMPRIVSIRVCPEPSLPRRRAMCTSIVLEPSASASSAKATRP